MHTGFWEIERESLTRVCAVFVAYCVVRKVLKTTQIICSPLPVLKYRFPVTGT